MSEVNVFLRCDDIFVILLGFVSWLPSVIANQTFCRTVHIEKKIKKEKIENRRKYPILVPLNTMQCMSIYVAVRTV